MSKFQAKNNFEQQPEECEKLGTANQHTQTVGQSIAQSRRNQLIENLICFYNRAAKSKNVQNINYTTQTKR